MDIDKLEGRELDRRIAEHLGYQDMQTSPDPDTLLYTCKVNASTGERYTLYPDVPHWHRDIAAAWELVKEMAAMPAMEISISNQCEWDCTCTRPAGSEAYARGTSGPEAISRCYLKLKAKESQ